MEWNGGMWANDPEPTLFVICACALSYHNYAFVQEYIVHKEGDMATFTTLWKILSMNFCCNVSGFGEILTQ